ncbi:hypothetical protein SAMN05216249_10749 [Acetitomaculum ruminis DSM 5522]|uniref:Uncharacterized protein n=1 Tax=Acetitomaculum ruminis DSM 5522 TaxID=1120918 RepID=A0A1I0XQQ9_9FIRM|nr:hypothetical protein [Acetitomaculum ruminis]SFB02630.1 hypothetical protein SAMN05216249_10749 [Acetitomaculum ruminis DSM 5522]
MKEIFEQYGSAVISVVIIVALVAIFGVLLNSESGVVTSQFKTLITQFFSHANALAGIK